MDSLKAVMTCSTSQLMTIILRHSFSQQTEAAARLTELERLLDEHDQIIRELKRSESDSGCINYVGVTPAPSCSSANNLDILPITVTPPTTSRTAPTSPLCSQPRSAQHQGGWKVERENSN